MSNQYLSSFNDQIEKLADMLIKKFPDNTELKVAKNSMMMLKSMNNKKLIELFADKIYKNYKQHIMDRNEEFFLNKDFVNDTQEVKKTREAFELMELLRKEWRGLDADEKVVIWKCFTALTLLTERYIISL
jgi:predicted ATP-dependent endonuclease of OLD family